MALHPNRDYVNALISNIEIGCDTGINPLPTESFEIKNNFSALRDPVTTSKLLKSEVEKGYVIGPFPKSPFSIYRVQPLSLAERKYSKKKRLCTDMSSPHDNDSVPSINSLISKEDFQLKYVKFDEAISIIKTLGRGALLCKADLVDAFKNLAVRRDLIRFQGVKWKGSYYFWTRLCFGCRSSPFLFNMLSEAIAWILKNNYDLQHLLFLLDDFLSIDAPGYDAEKSMIAIKHLFKALNLEWAPHKTSGPSTCLEYLGIIIDTIAMECRLPLDKLHRIQEFISIFLCKTTCTQRELLQVIGHLVFAAQVLPAGRSFLSRLFTAAYSVKRLNDTVYLSENAKADLSMWSRFLNGWNGISLFLDIHETTTCQLELFTDASGKIGYGGFFQNSWFQGRWDHDKLNRLDKSVSISYQELYPIVVAAILWGHEWAQKRVKFLCDNQGTVEILCKGSSSSSDIMKLMRKLTLIAISCNFTFVAEFLPGRNNDIADALSRFQMDRFRKLAPNANIHPCQIPSDITML